MTKTHSLYKVTQWRHRLCRYIKIKYLPSHNISTILQKLINSRSIPTNKRLPNRRHLLSIHIVHIDFVCKEKVKAFHFVCLNSKVDQSLTIIVDNVRITVLFLEKIGHTFLKDPLVWIGEVCHSWHL